MSFSRLSLVALLCGLWAAFAAPAQSPPLFERFRIGLPTGQGGLEAGCTRNGFWAPVAITLRGGKEGNPQGVYRLRIETTDLEEIAYQTTVPVPALAAETLKTVVGYVVPAGDGSTFRVLLETQDGKVLRNQAIPSRESGRDVVVAAEDILFLGAGAGLAQLKRSADKLDKPDGKDAPDLDQGRRQFAIADEVELLPDRWIGYDGVDVVVLTTGKRDFVLKLAEDSEAARRTALLEWVRRGGQVIMSVGKNKQEVAQLLAKLPLLDVKITGSEVMGPMRILANQWSERQLHQAQLEKVEVATLVPGPRVAVMLRENRKPVIVQGSYGLGRVVLVGFDLDAPPFTTWDGQEAFWTRMQKEIAPYLTARDGARGAAGGPPVAVGRGAMRGIGMPLDEQFDMRGEWKRGLETFEEAPTISFGWVALFLLLYILLVGPLDYFVLKKIFKRLELTWITFPLTAILVSVAAYWTAYTVKGDDLRVNKIDLVEIDLHEPRQVYGTSWFTLFSPRVQGYTIGIEPASDTWTAPVPEGAPGPVVTLLEVGDKTFRAGSQELFRRPYEYADEEAGLRRVPIPVWSTRSFAASWRAPVQKDKPAIGITDDVGPVRVAREGKGLVGRITNNLPVRLQDVTLIYREKRYFLDRLEPGEQKRIEPLFAGDAQGQNRDLSGMFQAGDRTLAPGLPVAPSGRLINANFLEERSAYRLLKPMLFYRASERTQTTNAGFRRFDQTWRLRPLVEYPLPERPRYRDEAILLARTVMLSDRAEDVTKHAATASRLWVGALPDGTQARPELRGYVTQETYVRVFVPVE